MVSQIFKFRSETMRSMISSTTTPNQATASEGDRMIAAFFGEINPDFLRWQLRLRRGPGSRTGTLHGDFRLYSHGTNTG